MEKTSTIAIVSIVTAIGSFFLTFSGHQIASLIAALISIPCGIIGFIMAASPRVSGGILSIVAIFLGIFAAGVWVLAAVGGVIF